LAGVFVVAGLGVPATGVGAAPTIERIEVDETFVDDDLTEACGVPVTTTVRGHIIERTLAANRTGPTELRTVNFAFSATSGDRTFRFRDVGADLARIEPDGTAVLSIIGQVPFDFAGVLKIDLETGEAILEPRSRTDVQLARACAVLAGG
jgi:hypothetical protein